MAGGILVATDDPLAGGLLRSHGYQVVGTAATRGFSAPEAKARPRR
jgi:hypothetical protein